MLEVLSSEDEVQLKCHYKSEFFVDGVEEELIVEKSTFEMLKVAIDKIVNHMDGRQEFSNGIDHVVVKYGGPDYQPIVSILNKRSEGVMSISIPESECGKLIG
ncbi:hypothetical protein [Gallaecimonas pentaromativorans]|uniref:hypothetical protein n=1 Tax=Gallaecimonas pentaromativorans TaxID=584787 RepID=UPI003A920C35